MSIQCVTAKNPTESTADLLDLLAPERPPSGPPETRNAAPAGPRNGVAIGKEAGQPQTEIYDLLADLQPLAPSPLDRAFTLTTFTDARSTRQQQHTTSLRRFADSIRTTRAPTKSALPWLKLASFGDVPTMKGALRHEPNMLAVDGVEGDYDAGKVSIDQASRLIAAAGLAALIYTTPSHTAAAPRWRVLAPTSVALSPDERDLLAERLNGALGGILARESFVRAQAYYYGALTEGRDHEVRLIEGQAIDLATDVPRLDRYGRPPQQDDNIDLLADLDDGAPAASIEDSDEDDLFAFLPIDAARITDALSYIPADDRDDWLRVGMALHAEGRGGNEAFDLWCEWARQSEKFDAPDQRRTWRSFKDSRSRAVSIASLYDLAKAHGWAAKLKLEVVSPPSRLTFLSPSECEASPSRGYVLKGMIATGDIGCIFGQPGAGKSLIAPHIGYAVAQGRKAFGLRTKPGKVFYVAAEDAHGMRGRVTALKLRHGDAAGFTLVEGVSDLLSDDAPDLIALRQAVETERPTLIFLDTLAMAFPGLEENTADGMGRVVAVARSLTAWGAAVILVHHSTKAEGKTPRGHSVFNGALDMAMHVERDEDGTVRGALTKNRNGSCERPLAFTIAAETLGADEDGDPITAALVSEGAEIAFKSSRVSPSASAALAVLREMEAEARTRADNEVLSGSVRPCPEAVSEADWRFKCMNGRSVSAAEDVDSRARAFRRAYQELARTGRTTSANGFVREVKDYDLSELEDFDDAPGQ